MKTSQIKLNSRRLSLVLAPQDTAFLLLPVYEHFMGRNFHQQGYMCDWNVELFKKDYAKNIIASNLEQRVARNGHIRSASLNLRSRLLEDLCQSQLQN